MSELIFKEDNISKKLEKYKEMILKLLDSEFASYISSTFFSEEKNEGYIELFFENRRMVKIELLKRDKETEISWNISIVKKIYAPIPWEIKTDLDKSASFVIVENVLHCIDTKCDLVAGIANSVFTLRQVDSFEVFSILLKDIKNLPKLKVDEVEFNSKVFFEYIKILKEILNSKFDIYIKQTSCSCYSSNGCFEIVFPNNRKAFIETSFSIGIILEEKRRIPIWEISLILNNDVLKQNDLSAKVVDDEEGKKHYVDEPAKSFEEVTIKFLDAKELLIYLEDISNLSKM